jgi:RNA polymerase sigma-70 factor (ECF subfamily)
MKVDSEFEFSNKSWNILVGEIKPTIRRAIFKYVYGADSDTVKDIEQDVLIKIYNRFYLYKKDRSIHDWVYIVTVNHIIDLLRKRRKFTFISIDSKCMLSVATSQNSRISVYQLLSFLPDEYRVILMKKYILGYKQKEIASELNLPIGTVAGRIQAGISKLKTIIQQEGLLIDDFYDLIK